MRLAADVSFKKFHAKLTHVEEMSLENSQCAAIGRTCVLHAARPGRAQQAAAAVRPRAQPRAQAPRAPGRRTAPARSLHAVVVIENEKFTHFFVGSDDRK